ncbi:capsular polysaccharide biosynthesis protein [uncultured Psychrobacter sp.]|uniref:capsular polysaccharide biosynthesis protein n=1 Tax=uncultured Psychrobacter sp. TaxID=259303 RepID=UPI0034596C9E
MVKSVANEDKTTITSTSKTATSLPSAQPLGATSVPNLIPNRLAVIGKGMRNNNALLANVLQADIQRWYPWSKLQHHFNSNFKKPHAFIGWGHKKSYQRAKKAANRQNIATLSIEDGFLRSIDSGISSRYGLSVVVDDIGIYFDLWRSSRLEELIIKRVEQSSSTDRLILDKQRAQQLMARICTERLSKYNAVIDCPSLDDLIDAGKDDKIAAAKQIDRKSPKSHVLLIDQVVGDASIKGAGADKRHFKRMLKAACQAHPDAHIWIKAHPAAKAGYLTSLTLPENVRILTQALNPIALLAQVNDVYTVSSHMGFEALMLGKAVHCFGVNWYSGWGLSDDSGAPKRLLKTVKKRRQVSAASLETLFYSAYIDYSRYVDPATKQACTIDSAINWLVTNRYWQTCLAGDLTVYEFSRWKLPFVKAFIDLPRTTLFIKPKPRLKNLLHLDHFRVNYQQPLLVWGLAKRQQVQKKLSGKLSKQSSAIPTIFCMEDGFIRSNGLGATLLAPLSVVIDQQGIYYNATQPSDLETLLYNCKTLSAQQITRVQALQTKLLTQRVSKYNVGNRISSNSYDNSDTLKSIDNQPISWVEAAKKSGKLRLLIVGQVEDDLSVQYCGAHIQTNSSLIERVRQDNPDAYLIYKPHPDVEAGLRAGKVTERYLKSVQAIAYNTAMPDCLTAVDEVHTISSLTGFEALLRDLKVVCYGLPFYAGWGLTVDIDAQLLPKSKYLQRRKRKTPLTLEQLLHATLIDYPLYRLPNGYGLAQVEQVIDNLYPGHDEGRAEQADDTAKAMPAKASKPSALSTVSVLSAQLKRRATTQFMQKRHQWQQRLRKTSR